MPVSQTPIEHGNLALPEVALVVNVGAGFQPAMQIPTLLRAEGVPATFMVMGWVARRSPEIVRELAADGFEIGSHGDQIADLTQASDSAVVGDLLAADRTIALLTGASTRPLWSPSAGAQDARVRRLAASLGYDTLLWNVDSGDWRTDASQAAIEAAVLPRLNNGAIVVLHLDSTHSVDATVPALRQIIAALRERGLRPVPMSILLAHLPPASG